MHKVLPFVALLASACGIDTTQPPLLAQAREHARFTPVSSSATQVVAVDDARELSMSTPTLDRSTIDVDEVASESTPPPPQPDPSTPAIVSFDVADATPVSIDLAWTTTALSSCTLNGASVGPNGSVTFTTSTESGLRTYQLQCTSSDGTIFDASRSVFWGDALSVQDVIGARALVGSLTQQTTEFITDFDNSELRFVTGNFELDFDPLLGCTPVSVAFSVLETIGGNLILVDNAGVASFSFGRLVSVGAGIDITGNAQLTSINFPELTLMGTSSTFAAQQDPLLSCEELGRVYCALAQQGAAFVPACPEIVPGCPLE